MDKERKGILQMISVTILWSIIPVIVRLAQDFGIYNMAFFRVGIVVLSILVFMLFARKKIVTYSDEIGKLIIFSLVYVGVIIGYFVAIQRTTIPIAVLLFYTSSVWMVVFGKMMLKERIDKWIIISLALAMLGVALIIYPVGGMGDWLGNIVALLAGVGSGFEYVVSKTFKDHDRISLVLWQNVIAIPVLLPLLFFDEVKLAIGNFTLLNSSLVIILGVSTAVALVVSYIALQKIRAQISGVLVLLEVFFAILLGWILFNEAPDLRVSIGGVLILSGVIIVWLKK